MRSGKARAAVAILGVLAGSVSAALAPVAARAQGSQTIAIEPFVSKIASFGGVLVWSHWDPVAKAFRLIERHHGHVSVLPIAARSVPFDVDLGPDARGRTVAVYSRCARERAVWVAGVVPPPLLAPGGCVLYRFDFGSRRERRIPGIVGASVGSFYLPAIWKDEIAYVRGSGAAPATLLVQPLSAQRRQRIVATALPGGPAPGPGPVALALRAGRLAFAWDGSGGGQFDSGIYLDTIPASAPGAPSPTQVSAERETSDYRSPGLVGFPELAAAGLFYGRFDGSAIVPNNDAFERVGLDGASAALAPAPHALRAEARDGDVTYAMYGPYAGTFGNCGLGGCSLVAILGVRYQ